MRTSLRALLSVVMLVGFYVFAFGLVVALCAFGFQAAPTATATGR